MTKIKTNMNVVLTDIILQLLIPLSYLHNLHG